MRRMVQAVLRKELLDHLRDGRSIGSAMLFPLFGPVVFALMMTVMASWADAGTPVKLAVVNAGQAPNLVAFLTMNGVELVETAGDHEAKIREGELDAAVVLADDHAERWRKGLPAEVLLLADQSRRASGAQVRRVNLLLETYSGRVGAQRLLARGVTPELARPLAVEQVDLATPERLAAMLLNVIPLFLVLAAFVGGMNVAIDATAGERERGSLEPLLVNPVARGAVVGGKWLGTVTVAAVAVVLTLAGFMLAMGRVPLEVLGVRPTLGVREAVMIAVAVLPLTLLASAVQMLVATYARSFKEAQTYLSLLLFVPVVPGMITTFVPLEGSALTSLVPVLGQHLLIDRVLAGEGLPVSGLGLSLVGLALPTALCLWACGRLLHSERIIFGR
jgi:sodium transport system permease protein